MCYNPATWHDSSQVKLTSEKFCRRTNYKTKCKLKSQNPFVTNHASFTWEQLWQCLGNNRANHTREPSCHFQLETVVSVTLGSNRASLTWEQSCQCHLGTTVPVALGNNRASVTWEQYC